MQLSVCKTFSFAAAHSLPGYDGPCSRLHGHEWVMEVEVSGPIDPITGMVLDFVKLKELVNTNIISKLDHQHLNEIYTTCLPTAENMVGNMADVLQVIIHDEFGRTLKLERLRLYETPTSFCEWQNL